MILLFHGENDFSLREAVAELKASLGDPSLIDLNTSVLDGRALTFPELQAHCETVPFLAPARLVLVEGLLSRFASRTQDDDPDSGAENQPIGVEGASWSELPDLLHRLPPTTTLVFIEQALSGRNPVVRSISKLAEVRQFSPIRGAVLQQWIQDRVARTGGNILPGAVRALADLVGDNLWAMAAEVEKLSTYALDRSITEQDVQALTVGAREASIFTLVDAIVGHNLPRAAHTLRQLLDDGAAPPYILFMVARQVRALLLAKDLLDENRRAPANERLAEAEIGGRIGVTHPYALRKTLDQARSASFPQLVAAHHRLLEADLALKTGRMEGDLAVELLVVELCRAGGTGPAARRGAR